MTTNFDVLPNEAHTYNITILSDSETDTRITSYTLDISDWWPRTYNVPDNDYGELDIYVTNKSDYTFTGTLKVMKGDGEKFAAGDGGWDFGPRRRVMDTPKRRAAIRPAICALTG